MPKVLLLAGGPLDQDLPRDWDLYLGVDAGALTLLKEGLPLDYALGDFDSVSLEERAWIEQEAKVLVTAQSEKDDTDLELALLTLFKDLPQAQVRIYGALGGRLDHSLANVFLPSDQRLAPFMEQLSLVDKQNYLTYLAAGRHEIKPRTGWTYLAFLPVQDQVLRIEGAKYPLTSQNYFFKKVYASNEFIGEPIHLSFTEGYVVLIFSKD